jgi:hypothetical protein
VGHFIAAFEEAGPAKKLRRAGKPHAQIIDKRDFVARSYWQ